MLTAVAVMIGVGFLAGTLVYGDTARAAFYDDLARAARNVDASAGPERVPFGDQTSGFTESSRRLGFDDLDAVRGLPQVLRADGRMAERLSMLDPGGRLIANFGKVGWAVSTPGDHALSMFDTATGRLPQRDGEIAIDSVTAEVYHFGPGASVDVIGPDGRQVALTLVGTFDLGANKRFAGLSVAALTPGDMRAVAGATGYAEVVASARPGVTEAALAAAMRERLGAGPRVLSGERLRGIYATAAAKYVNGFLVVLFAFGLVALAVSVFVIANTFAILVAQRVRELAMLRCVGASRTQLFGSVVLEAFVVGLVASVGGLVASAGVGWVLLVGRDALGKSIQIDRLVVAPTTVAVALTAGTVCTVLASLLPALTASRVPPMAALSAAPVEAVLPGHRRLRLGGAWTLAGAGALLIAGGTQAPGFLGVPVVFLGAISLFAAAVAAGPFVIGRVTAWAGWLPSRLFGAPARLAVQGARRNPKRVAATTGALAVGLALMSLFAVLLATTRAQSERELDENFAVDYVVTGGFVFNERTPAIPATVVTALHARTEFAAVSGARSSRTDVDGRPTEAWSMEPGALGTALRPEVMRGSVAQFGPGDAALKGSLASAVGAEVGSNVTLEGRTLRVVAIYDDAPSTGEILLDWTDFATAFGARGPDSVLVKAAEGVPSQTSRAAVDDAVRQEPRLQVSSQAEWRAKVTETLDRQLLVFSALLGMSIVIALTGIANTLALSVLERSRESSLLRALGLSRAQLRWTLILESVLMAVVGAVVGLGLGVVAGAAAAVGLIRQYGHGYPVIPVGQLALYALLATAAAALAALPPARQAMRTTLP
ncbi:FtsX-like permease family protein [Dactylosporangium vinaceum]|uniref:ABC transporter permease n=1 Tax=Dactylosporangium vinaceum TaxID=53362 RepID=A0ABV5M6W5_9ACTN|nr:ABC transporter permease [Dactylosporangium vinaceum]UAB97995.1 FtsX-like permease family protein [Dactylosporangium vinaceum]